MKFVVPPLCLALVALSPAAHCADQPKPGLTSRPEKQAEGEEDKKDSRKPPYKGMTKAQARHFYGDPDSVGHRDGEELWTYVLNRGSVIGRSFIPFDFGNKFRFRLLTFRGDKVVEFRWDKPE